MTDLELQLANRGFTPDDITYVVDLIEERNAPAIREATARFLCLVFLRVEKDSPAGCALRRALGFSNGVSLSRAARDFCVSKQYLEDVQARIEDQLGQLSFLAREARAAAAPPPGSTGPSGRSASQR